MKTPRLRVRDIAREDIAALLAYWREASEADLARLGELARPDEKRNAEFLEWFCAKRPSLEEAGEDILIWEKDALAIGYCTLKDAKAGETGQIHLHMWERESRGKGLGAILFCLSAVEFRKRHRLTSLFCQPKADNPMPNRMLRRVGFPELGEVTLTRADGSSFTQSRYEIDETTALLFLATFFGPAA
jgi:RimJ/RimL family protein N-acetyltransferase